VRASVVERCLRRGRSKIAEPSEPLRRIVNVKALFWLRSFMLSFPQAVAWPLWVTPVPSSAPSRRKAAFAAFPSFSL